MKILAKNLEDTAEIARQFLEGLAKGQAATVVGLSGELGAGKTHFTQAVASELGISEQLISPTFVIMKRYEIPQGGEPKGFKNFFHLDAYRLNKSEELAALGWAEVLADPENLVFIEWPENVAKAIPLNYTRVQISHKKDNSREFVF